MHKFKFSKENKNKLQKKDLNRRIISSAISISILVISAIYGTGILAIQIALYSGIPLLIGFGFFWHRKFITSLGEPELSIFDDEIKIKGFETEDSKVIEFVNIFEIADHKEGLKLITQSRNKVYISKNFEDFETIKSILINRIGNNNKA